MIALRSRFVPNISTLAPREGSDRHGGNNSCISTYFYPRSPRGERQEGDGIINFAHCISTLAPREGSDTIGPCSSLTIT